MRKELEFLKKDRTVTDAFKERLKSTGFIIEHGKFVYWDNEEYVKIGDKQVWLVESAYSDIEGKLLCCKYRTQKEIIEEIIKTIVDENERLEHEDRFVAEFFNKLSA